MAATEDRCTGGRWVAHTQNGNVYVSAGMQQMVAQVYAPAGSDAMSNARVMAAAPTIAEKAMQFTLLVEKCFRGGDVSEAQVATAMYELRAAIAASRGAA